MIRMRWSSTGVPDWKVCSETTEPIRINRERLGQDLQRHLPVELGIGGLVDLAHAPLADKRGHVVVGELGIDCQGHRCQAETGAIVATRRTLAYPVAQKYGSDAYVRLLAGPNI